MFEDLVEKNLVKAKPYPNGLTVYKYAPCVFYDNLWNTDKRLLDARGMVLDAEGNKVIWPFTKVFNRFENNTNLSLDTPVIAPVKMNGFMASVTCYHDEMLVSTTGTLDSDYVKLATRHLEEYRDILTTLAGYATFLFEICSSEDPHIIEEQEGAYLIGIREHSDGRMWTEEALDNMADVIGCKRPYWIEGTFGDIVELNAKCEIEGYMIRLNTPEQPIIMKLKSPYYLATKFVSRMGDKKIDTMYSNADAFKKIIDEEFYSIVEYITSHFDKEAWKAFGEQGRREIVKGYFDMWSQY